MSDIPGARGLVVCNKLVKLIKYSYALVRVTISNGISHVNDVPHLSCSHIASTSHRCLMRLCMHL